MMPTVSYTQDSAALDRILGRNWEGEPEEPVDESATDAAVTDDTSLPESEETSPEDEVANDAIPETAVEEEITEATPDDVTPDTAVKEEMTEATPDDITPETAVGEEMTEEISAVVEVTEGEAQEAPVVLPEETASSDSSAVVEETVEAVQDEVTATEPVSE